MNNESLARRPAVACLQQARKEGAEIFTWGRKKTLRKGDD